MDNLIKKILGMCAIEKVMSERDLVAEQFKNYLTTGTLTLNDAPVVCLKPLDEQSATKAAERISKILKPRKQKAKSKKAKVENDNRLILRDAVLTDYPTGHWFRRHVFVNQDGTASYYPQIPTVDTDLITDTHSKYVFMYGTPITYANFDKATDPNEIIVDVLKHSGKSEMDIFGVKSDYCYSMNPFVDDFYKSELYRENEDDEQVLATSTLDVNAFNEVYEWCWQAIRRRCLCLMEMQDFPKQLMSMLEYEQTSGKGITANMAYSLRKMHAHASEMFHSIELINFNLTLGNIDGPEDDEYYAKAIRDLMGIGYADALTDDDYRELMAQLYISIDIDTAHKLRHLWEFLEMCNFDNATFENMYNNSHIPFKEYATAVFEEFGVSAAQPFEALQKLFNSDPITSRWIMVFSNRILETPGFEEDYGEDEEDEGKVEVCN